MTDDLTAALAAVRLHYSLGSYPVLLADAVERLTAERDNLAALAYLCPPSPGDHDGQTWRDWATQLEGKFAAIAGADVDATGLAGAISRVEGMAGEVERLTADRERLIELGSGLCESLSSRVSEVTYFDTYDQTAIDEIKAWRQAIDAPRSGRGGEG